MHIQIKSFTNTALQEKIPKISDDHLLRVIDEYATKPHHIRSHKKRTHTQKFINKRERKRKENLQEPEKYHPLVLSLMTANTGSEILDILQTVDATKYSHEEIITILTDPDEVDIYESNKEPTIHRIYCKAIRCCADLGEMDICWQIFENCKKDELISNELYNTMMWVCMYDNRGSKSLDKVLKLKKELDEKTVEYKLMINPRTYSTLLRSCIKAQNYHQGLKILDYVERRHPELLKHSRLAAAASNLLAMAGDVDKAFEIMDSFSELDEKALCRFEQYQLNRFLFKIAQRITDAETTTYYIEKAEMIFKRCLNAAIKHNVEIPPGFFAGMMDVYGKNGDFDSCSQLLRYMVDPKKKHELYPSPTARIFEKMLKSLLSHKNSKEKWKKLDSILKAMNKLDVNVSHFGFYLVLFDVCGDDIERAKGF